MRDEVYLELVKTTTEVYNKSMDQHMKAYVKAKVLQSGLKAGDVLVTCTGRAYIFDTIKYRKPYSFMNGSEFPQAILFGKELTQGKKLRKDGSVTSFALEQVGKIGEWKDGKFVKTSN